MQCTCFMCRAYQRGCKSSTQAVNSLKLIALGSQTTEPGMGPKVTQVLTPLLSSCVESTAQQQIPHSLRSEIIHKQYKRNRLNLC